MMIKYRNKIHYLVRPNNLTYVGYRNHKGEVKVIDEQNVLNWIKIRRRLDITSRIFLDD